jgi:hypothetical protein
MNDQKKAEIGTFLDMEPPRLSAGQRVFPNYYQAGKLHIARDAAMMNTTTYRKMRRARWLVRGLGSSIEFPPFSLAGRLEGDKSPAPTGLFRSPPPSFYRKPMISAENLSLLRKVSNRKPGNEKITSVYISAPVKIGGVDDIVTVLAHRDENTQRMYLHSAWTKESLLEPEGWMKSTASDRAALSSEPSSRGGVSSVLHELLNSKRC